MVCLLALIVFLFMLFKTNKIELSTGCYFAIMVIFLLFGYKVIMPVIFHFNYMPFLSIIFILILVNVVYYYLHKYIDTEVGANVKNTLLNLFPIGEMRYLVLFFLSLVTFSPFFLIKALIIFILSKLMKLETFFSLIIIMLGTIINSLLQFIPVTNIDLTLSLMIIVILVLIAIGYIVLILSTNYQNDYNFKTIFQQHASMIVAAMTIFSIIFILIAKQAPIYLALNIAVFAALVTISLLSNKIEYQLIQDSQLVVNNKYPYLYSIVIIMINICTIAISNFFNNHQIMIMVGQILFLIIFNELVFYLLKLPILSDANSKDYFISIKNNIIIGITIIIGIIIYVLIRCSMFNDSDMGTNILSNLAVIINDSDNLLSIIFNTVCAQPLILDPSLILGGDFKEQIIAPVVLISSLCTTLLPISLTIIYALLGVKAKPLVQSYKFNLIYAAIAIFIVGILMVGVI